MPGACGSSDGVADVLYADQAVLLLSDSGYAQCRDISVLREKGRRAKGIEGMKRGQIIRAVCAKLNNREGAAFEQVSQAAPLGLYECS